MSIILQQIHAALDVNDLQRAATLASTAYGQGDKDPLVLNLVAWQLEEEGRLTEAEAVVRQALARDPDDATLHVALGIVRRKQGQLKDSVACFEHAIDLDPSYAAPWFERGASFEKGGALADAADDYRHALSLDPQSSAAHAALAAVLARRGESASAWDHAQTALKIDPQDVTARRALAQIALEEQKFDEAVKILEPVAAQSDNRAEAMIGALTLLGDAHHGLGNYDRAYHCYAQAQSLFYQTHSSLMETDKPGATELLDRLNQAFLAADKTQWAQPDLPAMPVSTHVFLTGFPRSGTTLVENILATLPNSVAIEERPTLTATDKAYYADLSGLERFCKANAEELDQLRADYWQRAQSAAGEDLADKLFIDMDPFKGGRLPFIARLFPGAKIVVMRRDPRDVVWSCFHTSFAFNAGTMAFSTLESTARHYALSWSIIEEALASLPIDHFNLRYDYLVTDFDAATQALCAYLGVPWSEDLRRFDRTAQKRGVSTASASQVRKGLYNGSGRWQPYADYLKPIEPILQPWIDRFNAI